MIKPQSAQTTNNNNNNNNNTNNINQKSSTATTMRRDSTPEITTTPKYPDIQSFLKTSPIIYWITKVLEKDKIGLFDLINGQLLNSYLIKLSDPNLIRKYKMIEVDSNENQIEITTSRNLLIKNMYNFLANLKLYFENKSMLMMYGVLSSTNLLSCVNYASRQAMNTFQQDQDQNHELSEIESKIITDIENLISYLLLAAINSSNVPEITKASTIIQEQFSAQQQKIIKDILSNQREFLYDYSWIRNDLDCANIIANEGTKELMDRINDSLQALVQVGQERDKEAKDIFDIFVKRLESTVANNNSPAHNTNTNTNTNNSENGRKQIPSETASFSEKEDFRSSFGDLSVYDSSGFISPLKRNNSFNRQKLETENIRRKNKQLLDQKDTLEFDRDELQMELDRYKLQLENLKKENSELTNYKYYNSNLTEEVNELKQKLHEYRNVFDKNQQLLIRTKDLEYYQDKLKKANNLLNDVSAENTDMKHIIEELQKAQIEYKDIHEKYQIKDRKCKQLMFDLQSQQDLTLQFKMAIERMEEQNYAFKGDNNDSISLNSSKFLNGTNNSAAENSLLQEQYDEIQTELQKIKTENAHLTRENENFKSDHSKMSGEAIEIESKFHSELSNKRDEIQRLHTDIEELKLANKQAERRRISLEKQIDEVQSNEKQKLKNNHDKYLEVAEDLNKQKEKVFNLGAQLRQAKAEVNSLRDISESEKKRFHESFTNETNKFNLEKEQILEENRKLRFELRDGQDKAQSISADVNILKKKVDDLHNSKNALEASLSIEKQRCSDANKLNIENTREIKNLSDTIKTLNSQLQNETRLIETNNQLKTTLDQKESDLIELRTQINFSGDIKDIKKYLSEEHLKQKTVLAKELNEERSKYFELKRQYEQLNSDYTSELATSEKLISEATELKNKLKEVQKFEMKILTEKQTSSDLTNELDSVKAKLENVSRLKNQYKTDNKKLEEDRKSLLEDKKSLKIHLERIQFDLNQEIETNSRLSEAVQELKTHSDGLEERLNIIKDLKSKVLEENRLLQRKCEKYQEAQNSFHNTAQSKQEEWAMNMVSYEKQLKKLELDKFQLENKIMDIHKNQWLAINYSKKKKKTNMFKKIFNREKSRDVINEEDEMVRPEIQVVPQPERSVSYVSNSSSIQNLSNHNNNSQNGNGIKNRIQKQSTPQSHRRSNLSINSSHSAVRGNIPSTNINQTLPVNYNNNNSSLTNNSNPNQNSNSYNPIPIKNQIETMSLQDFLSSFQDVSALSGSQILNNDNNSNLNLSNQSSSSSGLGRRQLGTSNLSLVSEHSTEIAAQFEQQETSSRRFYNNINSNNNNNNIQNSVNGSMMSLSSAHGIRKITKKHGEIQKIQHSTPVLNSMSQSSDRPRNSRSRTTLDSHSHTPTRFAKGNQSNQSRPNYKRYNSNISSSERSSRTTSRNSENLAMSVDRNAIPRVQRPRSYTLQNNQKQRSNTNSFASSSSSSYDRTSIQNKINKKRETTFNESVTLTEKFSRDKNDSLTYSGPQPRSRLDVPPHCDASYIGLGVFDL